MIGICGLLKWDSLKKRRNDKRFILLYRRIKDKARLFTDDLMPLNRSGRNHQTMTFQTPTVGTGSCKGNFFPQTIGDLNALPEIVICSADDCISKFTLLVRDLV